MIWFYYLVLKNRDPKINLLTMGIYKSKVDHIGTIEIYIPLPNKI
jgi:hypothetical protein